MAIDIAPDPAVVKRQQQARGFVREGVITTEAEVVSPPIGSEGNLRLLQQPASQAVTFAPTPGNAWGGLGLLMSAQAFILQEAGYSLLGPLALNCATLDEGNMHLLGKVVTQTQEETRLAPFAAGAVYDGASEVYGASVAKRAVRRNADTKNPN
jgi:acyl-CoA dehydrogenase